MESRHLVILRKNQVLLKEKLEVDDVLDQLYQDEIFSHTEYNRCKTGADRCGTLLDILMEKGVEGYTSLCVVLDRCQPHIKAQLDRTSTAEGATGLLFVNKREHEEAILSKKEAIVDLQNNMSKLTNDFEAIKEELEATKSAREEDRQKYQTELEEERQKHQTELEEERQKQQAELEEEGQKHQANLDGETKKYEEEMNERLKVTTCVEECQEENRQLKERIDQLEKVVSAEKKKYEAVTQVIKFEMANNEQHTEKIEMEQNINNDGCVLAKQPTTCDESQLLLLPCLHAVCRPCLDHYTDQQDQENLPCPCGGEADVEEEFSADHARRNEAGYNISKVSRKLCTYKEHEQEVAAEVYCQDCDDFLCQECSTAHDERKKNKLHRRTATHNMETIPIQKWLMEKTCPDHLGQELVLYDHNCRKPICIVCSKGNHSHPDNEDLECVYQKRKATLEDMLRNHHSQIEKINHLTQAVRRHQAELDKSADNLTSEVVSVYQNIADTFLQRQKQLHQDIRLSLEGPCQAIRAKLKTVHTAEKTVNATRNYIQRVMSSTTKTELIRMSDVIQRKSTEDLKIELPSDDTRDTRVRLNFQGQKALVDIIEDFGSLATCLQNEPFTDSQPTLHDLRRDINGLTEALSVTKEELEETRVVMTKDRKNITDLQDANSRLNQGIPLYIVGKVKSATSVPVSCPPMMFSRERVYKDLQITEGELVNTARSGQHHVDQFKTCGTCSLPIHLPPFPSSLTASTYWETNSRVLVKERISWWTVLQMGISEEGEADTGRRVSRQRRSWCVMVLDCGLHPGCLCTSVCEEGWLVANCLTSFPYTPGTETSINLGLVLDPGRGRLGVIDVTQGRVLWRFNATFLQSLLPMFHVWPEPDLYQVRTRLISGGEVAMTDDKLKLLQSALFSQ